MPNERLRAAIRRSGHTYESLATQIAVDAKSVQRWVDLDRLPHGRNRAEAASVLGEAATWLWPTVATGGGDGDALEVVQLHTHRSALTASDWIHLFAAAEHQIDILVYAGLFMPEQLPMVLELITSKAADGALVRMLLGDPDSAAVELRGAEEGIGEAVATKVRNSLALLKLQLRHAPNVDVRLHATTLYTSIYRADGEMIANPHVIGLPAAQAPALHLRHVDTGGLFDTYAAAYERVWESATPAWA